MSSSTTAPQVSMRVAPRVWLGILVFLAYVAVICVIWAVNDVDYTRISESADTIARWYVAPLVGGAIVLVAAVSLFGWWRPALVESRPRYPSWVWLFPAVLALAAVGGLIVGSHDGITPSMWGLLVLGSVLVGFNEELLTRGQLIVALRSRFGERGVWLLSTLFFSLLHVPNMFFGTGVAGVAQLGLTFLVGSSLYLVRRVSGSLVVAMVVHGLWDFSTFATEGAALFYAGGQIALGIAAVITAAVLTGREAKNDVAR